MPNLGSQIIELYMRLGSTVLVGWLLGRLLPKRVPTYLGAFLFWIGVPIGIFAFLRSAQLSGEIWLAPIVAWVATLLGAGLAWVWLRMGSSVNVDDEVKNGWSKTTQGSFILASMVGNTGYLGYPISLALVGPEYFGWALFYDLLGSTLAAYGLGVILAVRFGIAEQSRGSLAQALLKNPALWSFALGLAFRSLAIPSPIEKSLQLFGWVAVALSLVLIGMRLSGLSSWQNLRPASVSLGIKMLIVPLVVGYGVGLLGITGAPQMAIVLQMAMPPAFATLVLAEVYNLDRELAVTALALGSIALIVTLPMWLLLFGNPI